MIVVGGNIRLFFLSFLMCILGTVMLFGQNSMDYQKMATDRPSNTFSSALLESKQLLLQAGVGIPLKAMAFRAWGTEAYFRYGLHKRFELGGGISFDRFTSRGQGLSALYMGQLPTVGARFLLSGEKNWFPEISVHYNYLVNQVFFSDNMQQDQPVRQDANAQVFRVALSKKIDDHFSLGSNISKEVGEDAQLGTVYTLNLGYYHGYYGAFFEIFGRVLPESFNNTAQSSLLLVNYNTGFWVQLKPNVRLDFAVSLLSNHPFNVSSDKVNSQIGLSYMLH